MLVHSIASEPVWYVLPFVCIHCPIPCPLHKAAVGSQSLTPDTYSTSSFSIYIFEYTYDVTSPKKGPSSLVFNLYSASFTEHMHLSVFGLVSNHMLTYIGSHSFSQLCNTWNQALLVLMWIVFLVITIVTVCMCTNYSVEGVFSPHMHGLRGLRNQFGLSISLPNLFQAGAS